MICRGQSNYFTFAIFESTIRLLSNARCRIILIGVCRFSTPDECKFLLFNFGFSESDLFAAIERANKI